LNNLLWEQKVVVPSSSGLFPFHSLMIKTIDTSFYSDRMGGTLPVLSLWPFAIICQPESGGKGFRVFEWMIGDSGVDPFGGAKTHISMWGREAITQGQP
jgi:hypothetical protein